MEIPEVFEIFSIDIIREISKYLGYRSYENFRRTSKFLERRLSPRILSTDAKIKLWILRKMKDGDPEKPIQRTLKIDGCEAVYKRNVIKGKDVKESLRVTHDVDINLPGNVLIEFYYIFGQQMGYYGFFNRSVRFSACTIRCYNEKDTMNLYIDKGLPAHILRGVSPEDVLDIDRFPTFMSYNHYLLEKIEDKNSSKNTLISFDLFSRPSKS